MFAWPAQHQGHRRAWSRVQRGHLVVDVPLNGVDGACVCSGPAPRGLAAIEDVPVLDVPAGQDSRFEGPEVGAGVPAVFLRGARDRASCGPDCPFCRGQCADPLPCTGMTVLIIGGSGFLGAELVRQATSAGRVTAATCNSRPGHAADVSWHRLDLRDPRRLGEVIDTVMPSVVDQRVQRGGRLGGHRRRPHPPHSDDGAPGIRLVHVSSDAVFSGTSRSSTTRRPFPIR